MKTNLFILLLFDTIVATISICLVYQFYISVNGLLRKIMIIFFSCLAWLTIYNGMSNWLTYKGIKSVDLITERIIAIFPLTIIIVVLLFYVVIQNRKRNVKR